jgi:uroporphyrinogen-III synthase
MTLRAHADSNAGISDGVLVTRPEPGATATAQLLLARGLRPVIAPFLEIRRRAFTLPPSSQVQAVLATSGNAVAVAPQALQDLPLFTVGNATAARAGKAGFRKVESAGGDAEALAALVKQRCDPTGQPLLLLVGKGQGASLSADLHEAGFGVIRRVVYTSVPVLDFPGPAAQALLAGGLRAALFFSAETARAFVRTLPHPLRPTLVPIEALAIAAPAAAVLRPLPWRQVRVALHPTQDDLLALL